MAIIRYYSLLNDYLDCIDCWGDSVSGYSNNYFDFLPTGFNEKVELVKAYQETILNKNDYSYIEPEIIFKATYKLIEAGYKLTNELREWLIIKHNAVCNNDETKLLSANHKYIEMFSTFHKEIIDMHWPDIQSDFQDLCEEKESELETEREREKESRHCIAPPQMRFGKPDKKTIKNYVTEVLKEYGIVK